MEAGIAVLQIGRLLGKVVLPRCHDLGRAIINVYMDVGLQTKVVFVGVLIVSEESGPFLWVSLLARRLY